MEKLKLTKKYDRYPEYKDSGVKWLDELPTEWQVYKMKRLFTFRSGDGFPDDLQGNLTGDIPFLKVSDINKQGDTVSVANNYISKDTLRKKSFNLIPQNSILIAKIGAALEKNHRKINTLPVCIDNNMLAVFPLKIDPKYSFWIWKHLNMSKFQNISSVPSINLGMLRNFDFPICDFNDQKKIARYLDLKITLIDDIIKKKQRMIKLFEEKKVAVINSAVTKGLDSNAEFGDKDFCWVGKIPKGWEFKKLKYLSSILPSNVDKLSAEGESVIKLCNYVDVYKNDRIEAQLKENFMTATASSKQIQKLSLIKDDVVITKDSETPDDIGIPAYVPNTIPGVVCGYHLAIIRPNAINGEYLFRFIESKLAKAHFYLRSNGLTRYALGIGDISDLNVSIPSVQEQEKIVNYLNKQTLVINESVIKIKKSIELLTEFKSSLISNVVTGKIKIN